MISQFPQHDCRRIFAMLIVQEAQRRLVRFNFNERARA